MKIANRILSLTLSFLIILSSTYSYAATFEVDGILFENFDIEPEQESGPSELDLLTESLLSQELVEDTSSFMDNKEETVALMSIDNDGNQKPEFGSLAYGGGSIKNYTEELTEVQEEPGEYEENEEEYAVSLSAVSSSNYTALHAPSFNNGVYHPHLSGRGASEYVSPFDGTLQLNYTDLHLPGRNGLDLNLNRIYKSELSNVEVVNSYKTLEVNNGTYYTNRYALGLGWAFGFPSVELREKTNGTYQAYYHDGTGTVYRSNFNDYKENPNTDNGYLNYNTNLDNYYTDNVEFDEKDHSYERDGIRSQYSFKTADNTMQYFGDDGRLLSIKDRFDNEIKFDYAYIPGENLLPFYSYHEYSLGNYWENDYSYIVFNNDSSTRRSSICKSQFANLNEFYDEYYISMLYQASGEHMNYFEGDVEVYCDLYYGNTIEESILIAEFTPDEYDVAKKIEGTISLNDYDFDNEPTKAKIRIEVKNARNSIGFRDIRFSPKMPLISQITDTIGRTLVFEYEGDIYTRYEDTPTLPLYIYVYDTSGKRIRKLCYIRNVYSYTADYNEGEVYYEQRFFFLWGCNNGIETNRVDYEYFEGEGATCYDQQKQDYSYNFHGRPIVSVLENRNSETCITFEKVTKWLDNRSSKTSSATSSNTGFIDTWRVVEKYDINYSLSEEENPRYNIYQYNYTTGKYSDETGYNLRNSITKGPGYIKPSIGSYKVVVTNPNGSQHLYEYTSHTFDVNYRRKWDITLPLLDIEKTMESNSTSADYVMKEYEYEDDFAIISPNITKTSEYTDGTLREYYSVAEYSDESCLPIKTSLPLTAEEFGNIPPEKLITTQYTNIGNKMYLPNKISYFKNFGENKLNTTTSYDSLGRVVLSTDAIGNSVSYEYSEKYPWMPSRISYSDPENTGDTDRVCETLYEYEDDYGFGATSEKLKFHNGKYIINKYKYEPSYSNLIQKVINGGATNYEYDKYGRVSEINYPHYQNSVSCMVTETYEYYLNSAYENEKTTRIIKNTFYQPTYTRSMPTQAESSEYRYNDYGNLLYQNTYAGEEKYIYDSAMRVVGYQNPSDFGTENISANYVYDGFDRVLSVTDKEGNIQQADYKSLSTEYSFIPGEDLSGENHVTVNYDMYGRTVSENIYPDGLSGTPLTTSYEYDLAGNVLRVTDANGKITESEYDDINNPVKITYADGSVVANEYTKWGSIKNTVRTDGIETYSITNSFNDAGSPLTHRQIGDKIETRAWNYEYGDDGRLVAETDPNGNVTEYDYDYAGNVKTIINGTTEQRLGYSYFGELEIIQKYVNNMQTEYVDRIFNNRNMTYSYDMKNGKSISYTYNTARNLTAITPTGYTGVTYTRDSLERVTGITSGEKQFTYEYYADGLVKKLIYPNSDIYVTYTYDNANRLNTLVVNKGTEVLKTYTYTYDNVGNITSVSGSDNISYTYDDLYRLKTYTQDGVTTTYEYDSRNNIKSESRPGYVKIYEYGGDNRLYSTMENGIITEYEYDLNGNIIKRGNDEFGYDQDNRLIYSKVNNIETYYEIGAENLRKKKTTDTTTTEYVTDKNGLVICENSDEIINGMTPLAVKRDGSYYYYICNGHGDVVMLLDEQGNVKNSYSYDPWGKITSESETVYNSIKYAGEYYDTENGLIYLRNRYYDPSIGRFTSEDPIEDGLNWYVYCENNPVNFVDPWGLAVTEEDKERYGEESKIYIALVNLDISRKAFPEYLEDIDAVENEIRWIATTRGVNNIEENIKFILMVSKNLSTVEQVLAAGYMREAYKIDNARKIADKTVIEIFNQEGNETDDANAFKHAYWNALSTEMIGAKLTKLFTDAHEFGWGEENKNNPVAMRMDLHNNACGIEIGSNFSENRLKQATMTYVYQGMLVKLHNGELVKTNGNLQIQER